MNGKGRAGDSHGETMDGRNKNREREMLMSIFV